MAPRMWLATLVLVGGCIKVPPFEGTPDDAPIDADNRADGSDAPGTACTPTGSIVSVFAFAQSTEATIAPTDVPYEDIERDTTCAFDGTRFTSPGLEHYLVCAGLSVTPASVFSLSAHTERQEWRIASGIGKIGGCVALALQAGEVLTILTAGQQAGSLATEASASWLAIDVIENGGQSAAAKGLTSNLIAPATPVDLETIERWDGNSTTVSGGPHLVCAALAFPMNATMQVYVDSAPYDLDATTAASTNGCRVINTMKSQTLTLRNTGSSMTDPTDRPAENWLTVERLGNPDWSLLAQSTPAIMMDASGTAAIPFMPRTVAGGHLEEATFTPAAALGGESLVCVNLTVAPPAKIALDVLQEQLPIEIASGSGSLHGCTVVSTSLNGSISVRARNLRLEPGTIAADPAATLTIHKIH